MDGAESGVYVPQDEFEGFMWVGSESRIYKYTTMQICVFDSWWLEDWEDWNG